MSDGLSTQLPSHGNTEMEQRDHPHSQHNNTRVYDVYITHLPPYIMDRRQLGREMMHPPSHHPLPAPNSGAKQRPNWLGQLRISLSAEEKQPGGAVRRETTKWCIDQATPIAAYTPDRHLTQGIYCTYMQTCRLCVQQRYAGLGMPHLAVWFVHHSRAWGRYPTGVVSWVARVGLPICCEGAYVIFNPAMATFHLGWIPLG